MPSLDDDGGFEMSPLSAVSKLVSRPAVSHLMVKFCIKLFPSTFISIAFYSNDVVL